MQRIFIVLFLSVFMPSMAGAQTQPSTLDGGPGVRLNLVNPDTLRSFLLKKDPPYLYDFKLKQKDSSFGNKFLRGVAFSAAYDLSIGVYLAFAPKDVSKWDKFEMTTENFINAYTKAPVWDHDLWTTNYLGHPYQGGFYYNSIRSQGGTIAQSALFSLGQSLIWEYALESWMEQPSIQDLVVTPVLGSLFGEITHVATIKMSKNGFKWYEIALVCALNPSYAINNGFKTKRKLDSSLSFMAAPQR